MAFSLDDLRRDIASLIHEEPEAIGLDDNLMDLGLDSMRALNLVLAWSERGVALDFSELAERPTLRGWWAIIQKKQAL